MSFNTVLYQPCLLIAIKVIKGKMKIRVLDCYLKCYLEYGKAKSTLRCDNTQHPFIRIQKVDKK